MLGFLRNAERGAFLDGGVRAPGRGGFGVGRERRVEVESGSNFCVAACAFFPCFAAARNRPGGLEEESGRKKGVATGAQEPTDASG